MKKANNYEKMVRMFLDTGELGDHNPDDFSITLYGIENRPEIIEDVRKRALSITPNCKIIVLDPKEEFTNIKILDIDL